MSTRKPASSTGAFAVLLLLVVGAQAAEDRVPRLAFICTIFRPDSHADVIGTKFFLGFPTDRELVPPRVKIVSMYMDQDHRKNVGKVLAERCGATIYPTIRDALTLGGKELAVDGVIYVGEHGNYPRSRLGVKMYPHLLHMAQIFRVYDEAGRSVPTFCDKQLAYSWLDSKWIHDRANELKVPLMAGSSLPLAWRNPSLEHPLGTPLTEAVAVGHGSLDSYGFHVLEMLQCMVERRKGGETGVAAVRGLKGAAVYEAARNGAFSAALVEAACGTVSEKKNGRVQDHEPEPVAVVIEYCDGTRGVAMQAQRYIGSHWGYAARTEGKTEACEFILGDRPAFPHFSYLGLNIQELMLTGKAPAPVERTLLTSGVLDAAVRSLHAGGKRIETPHLKIAYQPPEKAPIRPEGLAPEGASLGPWPPEGTGFQIPKR